MRPINALLILLLFSALTACTQIAQPVAPALVQSTPEPQQTPVLSALQQQSFSKAKLLLQQQQYQAAAVQLQQLWAELPQASGVGYNLALSQWQQGDIVRAQQTLAELTQRDAQYAAGHNLAGVLARQQGQFRQAERHFKQALAADANYGMAHKNLAILYELYLAELLAAHYHYQQYYQLTQDEQAKVWLALIQQQLEQNDADN